MKGDNANIVMPVRLGKGLVIEVDNLVKKGEYSSRSEVLREALRLLIRSQPKYAVGDIVKELAEYRAIEWQQALKQARGNKGKAAEIIGKKANDTAKAWGLLKEG